MKLPLHDSPFRILLKPARLAALRHDVGFAEAMTLGRIANLLRSVLTGSAFVPDGAQSAKRRGAVSAYFLLSALLAEAFPVLERSARHFRHLPSYDPRVRALLQNAEVQELRKKLLSPMRNEAVFHHDPDVSTTGMSLLQLNTPEVVLESDAARFLDSYHPLADALVMLYFVGANGGGADGTDLFLKSIREASSLAMQVCEAIDVIVIEALVERGFSPADTSNDAG